MENLEEGFRFYPTDAEAITFLLRFIAGKGMNDSGFITTHVDTYSKQLEPWDIYSHGVPCGNDEGDNDCSQYRYFIAKLKKKSESRYSRNVGNKGSWKQNFKSKPVRKNGGPVIGYKKSMTYVNKGYNGENGHWLMKEYDLSKEILDQFDNDRRDYVFCAIKKRTPTKDTKKLTNTVSEECTDILEHQTPAAVESTSYDEALQGGGVMDAGKYMQSSNLECTNLEHQTSVTVESTSYYEALQGGVVVDAGEYMQSSYSVPQLECMNLEYQTSAAIESTSYDEALQGGVVVDAGEYMQSSNSVPQLEFTNLEHQSSAAVESTSYYEALQGGGVVDAGEYMQSSNLVTLLSAPYTFEAMSMLDFDYEYLPADFDCLRSITA